MADGRQWIAIQHVRRDGDTLVVAIPDDDAERLGIAEGDLVEVMIRPIAQASKMRAELRAALEASWARNEVGYRYLAKK